MSRQYDLTVPTTYNNAAIPATRTAASRYNSLTVTSQALTLADDTTVIGVITNVAGWIKFGNGSTPTAAARAEGNIYSPAGALIFHYLPTGAMPVQVAFIKDTGADDGFINIWECA